MTPEREPRRVRLNSGRVIRVAVGGRTVCASCFTPIRRKQRRSRTASGSVHACTQCAGGS